MDPNKVLRVQDAVFILTGGVDDLSHKVLALVFDWPAEGILNGGIVTLLEISFDKTDGEGRFALRCRSAK
jgi:hypothetical protein